MKWLDKIADREELNVFVNEQSYNGIKNYCVELEYWSGLGEDCIITLIVDRLFKKDIIKAMEEYTNSFDDEEHASELYNLQGRYGTPTSLRDLLGDAEEQKHRLEHILETMNYIK